MGIWLYIRNQNFKHESFKGESVGGVVGGMGSVRINKDSFKKLKQTTIRNIRVNHHIKIHRK